MTDDDFMVWLWESERPVEAWAAEDHARYEQWFRRVVDGVDA